MRSRSTLSIIFVVPLVVAAGPAREAEAGPSARGRGQPAAARGHGGSLAAAPAPARSTVAVDTPLFAQPGEASARLAALSRGTAVAIVGRRGRWLEVRAGAARGWLPRTTVDEPTSEPAARSSTGGARGREPGSTTPVAPVRSAAWRADQPVRVGGARKAVWMDASALIEVARAGEARSEPAPSAPVVFAVDVGAALRPAGKRTADWLLVEDAGGTAGWIPIGLLRVPAASSTPAATTGAAALDRNSAAAAGAAALAGRASSAATTGAAALADRAPRSGPTLARAALNRPRWLRGRAAIGVSTLSMDFSSDGGTPLSAYHVSASGMAAFAGVDAGVNRGRVRLAVDGSYGVTLGLPGIRYRDAESGALDPVGFTWHHINAGARVGYRLADAVIPYARAGYRFDWFRVDEVENPGRLGREGLRGFTAGVGVEAELADELIARAGGDLLVGGGRKQTPGLEDGASSSALAAWGRLEASYLATPWLAIEGAYEYGWASTEWAGRSPRQPDVSEALRSDRSHLLLLWVQRDF
jgi:hypothetical protein